MSKHRRKKKNTVPKGYFLTRWESGTGPIHIFLMKDDYRWCQLVASTNAKRQLMGEIFTTTSEAWKTDPKRVKWVGKAFRRFEQLEYGQLEWLPKEKWEKRV